MSVVGAWINEEFFATTDLGQDSQLCDTTPNLPAVVQACALCIKSKFDASEEGKPLGERTILGDSTEVGLLRFACRFIDAPAEQDRLPKVFEIPFNSDTKWHLTVHRMEQAGSHFTAFIKGAPERIVRMCSHMQVSDQVRQARRPPLTALQVVPWTGETEKRFNLAYEHFAVHGRRVLALARQTLPAATFPTDHTFVRDPCSVPMAGFVFLGLVAIMDPPKHGVRKAIAACRTAGIQIVMVTGDHPLTAEVASRPAPAAPQP